MVDVEGPVIAHVQPSAHWPQPWCLAPPSARAVELTVAKNRQGDTGKLSLIFRPIWARCGRRREHEYFR